MNMTSKVRRFVAVYDRQSEHRVGQVELTAEEFDLLRHACGIGNLDTCYDCYPVSLYQLEQISNMKFIMYCSEMHEFFLESETQT